MTTPALLPRPFCGSSELFTLVNIDTESHVECNNCGARGPAIDNKITVATHEAAAAWNQRSAVGNCPELKNLVAAIDAEYHPESQGQHFTTELCNAIDAARAAVDNPPASAWQPIETAFRDGTQFLAWDEEGVNVVWDE